MSGFLQQKQVIAHQSGSKVMPGALSHRLLPATLIFFCLEQMLQVTDFVLSVCLFNTSTREQDGLSHQSVLSAILPQE